jgi:hypothetical protein
MRFIVMALGAAILAGCVSAEQQAQMDGQECMSYGLKPGTDAYAQCRMRVTENRNHQQAAAWQQFHNQQAQQAQEQAQMNALILAPRPYTPPTETNCRRMYNGDVRCITQ